MTQRTNGRPDPEPGPAMLLRGVSKKYGELRALNSLDFEVGRGEVFGLLGPNGAGKTTLVEILEGHIAPTTGTVEVLGMDPMKAGASVRDRLGVVPQKASFELYLTVREHIALFGGYYSRSYPVDEVIELVGLEAKRNTRTGRLSGGQQRRLDLALALVGDPDVVFLDEPTTGLDIEARDRCWETVGALRAVGKTVLITTHNMDEAQRLCDRVAVLHEGNVAAIGEPQALLPDERGGTISYRDGGAGTSALPPELAQRARETAGRVLLHTTEMTRDLNELTQWAVRSGVELPDLQVRRPELEELYLSILADRERSTQRNGVLS
ncbi:ABC transporter ATP-binding protein [Nocardiopsis sp. NPDC006832]|uniref:ABC transporter ATP-binding protein n=1 Tax=Nocardiopsis sp. NPDC006832 TaxID=3157188 RepID=UPI00340CA473